MVRLAANSIEHLVLYHRLYEKEALKLTAYRNSMGMKSAALDVANLPGRKEMDLIPPQCQGIYRYECYVVPGDEMGGNDIYGIASLYGMESSAGIGDKIERVADVAGLIRAYIRKVKLEQPSLRYVVLMGDPYEIPVRYSSKPMDHPWVSRSLIHYSKDCLMGG